jgi:hypothetical protein
MQIPPFPLQQLRDALAALPDDTHVRGVDLSHGSFTLLTSAGRVPVHTHVIDDYEPLHS